MKKIIFSILLTLFIIYCIVFPKDMAIATANGLALWYKNVLPTLLPFSILSYIIIHSNLYHAIFYKIDNLQHANSRFETQYLYPLLFGYLFGFPIGAKLIADLYDTGHISSDKITLFTAICNQFGPAFIINYICHTQLNDQCPAFFLLLAIYLPSICLLLLYFFAETIRKKNTGSSSGNISPRIPISDKKPVSRSYINFKIIDTGIINGFETMLRIAGYIVLFSILAGAFDKLPGQYPLFQSLVTGLLEVTTGVNKTTSYQLSFKLTYTVICGIVSFGGFCGIFQTKAIMINCPFYITKYILLKLLCAIISIFIIIWLITVT